MVTRVCAATSQDTRAKVGAIAAVLRPGLSAVEARRLPLPEEPLIVHAVLLALELAARHRATRVDVLLSEPFVAQKLRAGRSMAFPTFRGRKEHPGLSAVIQSCERFELVRVRRIARPRNLDARRAAHRALRAL